MKTIHPFPSSIWVSIQIIYAIIASAVLCFLCSLFFLLPFSSLAQISSSNDLGLFENTTLLELSLNGDTRKLIKDRKGKAKKFPMQLSYSFGKNDPNTIPVSVQARGNFRRSLGSCKYPPLRINFKQGHQSSIFKDQKKMKIVVPCQGEKYVIKEWLAYQIYELLTPFSFRTRIVKVQLEDSEAKKNRSPFFAFLLEEEKQMIKRNGKINIKKNLKPRSINKAHFVRMAIFQYLIANTDWSVDYRQNIKILADSSKNKLYAVPYDFDHAGLVSAPYAKPSAALEMNSVQERRYRGYCSEDWATFEKIVNEFIQAKTAIYQLIKNCQYLEVKEQKKMIGFIDDFYETLSKPDQLKKALSYPCDPNGTGNVVIQGLNVDKN